MNSLISLAEDTISTEELALAADFLTSGAKLTKGELTVEFEAQFAAAVGSKHAVYVNSGSSANLLIAAALKESGRLKNHVVVCPAVSWVTTVTPFMHLGFDVILCDSDSTSLGLDLVTLEQIFRTSQPSILALVHVLGHPNRMPEILALCEKYGVLLMEDSCEALGTQLMTGQWLGTLGLAGSFSFYYGHHISTIEGGMVVTDDFEFQQIMLSMRSHGWSRDLEPETAAELTKQYETDSFRNLYTFYYPGFNFRSTDLQAFIGLQQMKKIDEISNTRERNFESYRNGLPGFWRQTSATKRISSFAFGTAVENRAELAAALSNAHIESRPLICGNLGRHPFWLRHHSPQPLPVADWVHNFGLYLPNHARLSADQIDTVCSVVREVGIPSFPTEN